MKSLTFLRSRLSRCQIPATRALARTRGERLNRVMDRLPVGVSPVTAGRFGLWLLGRRQHTASRKRKAFPNRAFRGMPRGAVRLVLPWLVWEYPGASHWLAALCGVARGTAKNWLTGSQHFPAKHADRLALYLENHSASLLAAASELRAYAQSEQTKGQVKGIEKNRRRSNARAA